MLFQLIPLIVICMIVLFYWTFFAKGSGNVNIYLDALPRDGTKAMTGALNMGNFGITSTGSIAGATTIDGTGDLTMGTITMPGFSVDADGDTVTKSIDNSNGGITNTGAIAGATTGAFSYS